MINVFKDPGQNKSSVPFACCVRWLNGGSFDEAAKMRFHSMYMMIKSLPAKMSELSRIGLDLQPDIMTSRSEWSVLERDTQWPTDRSWQIKYLLLVMENLHMATHQIPYNSKKLPMSLSCKNSEFPHIPIQYGYIWYDFVIFDAQFFDDLAHSTNLNIPVVFVWSKFICFYAKLSVFVQTWWSWNKYLRYHNVCVRALSFYIASQATSLEKNSATLIYST